ncbi:MAG: photosystem reaction center subunit H, partial [Abditibacteriota bacterium]|nr:photosystem reaction center subunit H [Abditibacteriota bacterium]
LEPQKEPEPAPEPPKAPEPEPEKKPESAADKATEERHRRFLLGKKAARTIKMDNGIVIVEAGADITEEVLQKAKLANKFIELSMNIQ